MQVGVCSCTLLSVPLPLSVCVFVVAAVLEGVHFSFGSGPDPILFQVLSASAVVLWILHKQIKKKERKKKGIPKMFGLHFVTEGRVLL